MLLMRGAATDLKVMAQSTDSAGQTVPSTATIVHSDTNFRKTNNNPPTNKNNNKSSDNFKSQSPSEDKAIQYGGLPCETDHVYTVSSESGKYRELANEVANLKALVLFHLDLIQQQSECNAAKDKQLSALRHENEMLRQKLERMERRVQLQNSKQKSEAQIEDNHSSGKVIDSSILHSDSAVFGNQVATRTQSKIFGNCPPHTPQPAAINTNIDPSIEEVPRKRIKTLLPVRTSPCPVPPAKRRRTTKSVENEQDVKPATAPNDNILDDLINQAVKEGAIINVADTNVPSDHILEAKVILESLPVSLTMAEKDLGVSKPEENVLDAPVHPEHQRIREYLSQRPPIKSSAHLKKEAILTTEAPYLTHVGESTSELEVFSNEAQVEVPRWVIKPLSGRVSTQETENLDDEVFTKRHLKHETDEKRRKRWDLQRIREQRRYEKLRARYEGEDRCQDRIRSHAPSEQSANGAVVSLWSGPEDVTYVQVEPWLPVSAFGSPLPNLAPTDFQLPWSSSRSNEESSSTKRRQRRSYKTD